MQTSSVTPQPLPGGHDIGQFAASPLVAFEYAGTETAQWKEGGIFRKETYTATRDVTTSDQVFAMPHFNPDYAYRFRNRQTSNVPSRDRFIPAGRSFEHALQMAGRVNGASVNGTQPVAIVQANEGQYFLAPLGYYTNDGATFNYGDWTRPGNVMGDVVRGGEWKLATGDKAAAAVPKKNPGDDAESWYSSGSISKITPLHAAVKALVDQRGWYDLRQGATDAAGAAQVVAA
jgi:hypothetical protein